MPEENTQIKPVETDPAELVKPLAETMPEPTAPAPEELFPDLNTGLENAPENIAPPAPPDNDKVFNPDIHATNPDGSPRKNKDGTFSRKRGRKSGVTNKAEGVTFSEAQNATGVADEYDHAAALYFDTGSGVAVSLLSEEWNPDNPDERAGMVRAIAAYLRAKGSVDISPGQALTFALIAYAGKRLSRPTTKERLKLWFLKVREMIKKK